jgi:hypothetical protein
LVSIDAADSDYMQPDDANDQLEVLTTANQKLLFKVSNIGKEVQRAIEKIRTEKVVFTFTTPQFSAKKLTTIN